MQSTEKDFNIRKGQAWIAFRQLSQIWKSKTTSRHLKISIFKAACLSILMYGSETWVLEAKLKKKLGSFATNCYRQILNIKRLDKISNEKVYEMVGQEPLTITLAVRQLTWIGHMLRRPQDELIRKFALYGPAQTTRLGKMNKGAQKLTYIKQIACLLNPNIKENLVKLDAKEIERWAQDRKAWRNLVIDCTGTKSFR